MWCLLLILIKKLVWHAEHEWVNFFNKFGLHQSKTEGDTEGIKCEICLCVI